MKCSLSECSKKLSISDISLLCKCKKSFCSRHRQCEDHKCIYDFKESYRKEVEYNKNREYKNIFHENGRDNSSAY